MTLPISGQQLDPEEEQLLQQTADHWRQVWNDAPVQALVRIEDAARQVITITAGLQAFYVGIFAFSDLRSQIANIHSIIPNWLVLLSFFLSPVCWLASLAYATYVFIPRIRPGVNFNEVNPGSWQKVKDAYAKAAGEKLHALHWAHRWLVASFMSVLLAIVLFVVLPASPK